MIKKATNRVCELTTLMFKKKGTQSENRKGQKDNNNNNANKKTHKKKSSSHQQITQYLNSILEKGSQAVRLKLFYSQS